MLYVVGGNDKTPVKKVTNAGGVTTLVQDPSNRYKGPDLNNVNVTARPTNQPTGGNKASTTVPTSTPTAGPTQVEVSGGDGGGGFDWYAYFEQLAAERQRRADEAYERNMQRIADAYGSASGSLWCRFQ